MAEEKDTLQIYLENGEEIILEYNESVFDEVTDELHKAMKTGGLLSLDGSYDVNMHDIAGNYISALNGRKIVGYNL